MPPDRPAAERDDELAIREARTADDFGLIARLAREIWVEHYTPIIGEAQVEYMLERFQSAAAVAHQVEDAGVLYFVIEVDGAAAGYLAVEPRGERLFLSKVYLRQAVRGRGHARRIVAYVRQIAGRRGCRIVELTVNRRNHAAIGVYTRLGFRRTGDRITDIGQGFVMDDFVYELDVGG